LKVEGAGQHSRNRDAFTSDMVRVTDGVAVVGLTDRAHSTVCPDGRILRRSGHVGTETTRTFSGGRFVIAARIRMPSVDGPHSAFWMKGIGPVSKSSTPDVPVYEDLAEMDIAEFFGPESDANCHPGGLVRDNGVDKADWSKLQTNFYYNYATQEIAGVRHCTSNAELHGSGAWGQKSAWDGYHVYAVDWSPNKYYRVWLDGVLVRTFDGPELSSGRASFLVMSQLIDDGDEHYAGPKTQKQITVDGKVYKPGADYLTANDLSAMKVDWVRVWKAS
jgi:beta-glucanase (GH16 family)